MLLFNRYQYEPTADLIGKGEFTEVYEALDTHIYLPVAVKIYRAIESSEKFGFVQVDKFGTLDHPNICRYLHIGEIRSVAASGEKEKRQVCVMELLKDGDFASYYQAYQDPELLRRMVLDILHGLTYLHSQRIVHRRLKPSNLLVGMTTQGPVVKITDFGLGSGKAASRDARFSSMIVEVERMAPEQFNPKEYGVDGNVSYHVDFWGLGLAVYEALTNNDVLFKYSPNDSREQVIKNILSSRLPEKLLRLPAPFDRFLMRCLAKHADQRPQNTRELIELLSQPIGNVPDVEPVLPVRPMEVVRTVEVRPAIEGRSDAEERTGTEGRSAKDVRAGRDMRPASPEPMRREKLIVVIPPHEEERGSVEDVMTTAMIAPMPAAVVAKPVRAAELHPFFRRYEYHPEQALIGKGGFSRVYKAFDKKLDRWVALKFYKSGEYNENYSPIAEIRRVINLDHPNICRYLDIEEIEKENAFGEKESTQVSVMELLDGGTLLEYFADNPTKEVLKKLVGDVLQGLAYLHRNGIIHRDIKPANILVRKTSDGPVAKITDFGVSKLSNSENTKGNSALVVSIPYMAPEQLNVRKYGVEEAISSNLDLWAVGVTIYEVVTGKVLFRETEGDSNEEIMANILAPGLQDKIAELPQPYLDIVRRCLVRDARRRAQRAEELIELLERPEPVMVAAPEPKVDGVAGVGAVAPGDAVAAGGAEAWAGAKAGGGAGAGSVAPELRGQVEEPKPEMKVPPESQLIPEPAVNTQDLFVPEKSWVWAEAVSAPEIINEPARVTPAARTNEMISSAGFRIGIVAAIVVALLLSYIITQNHRYSKALLVAPAAAQTTESLVTPVRSTIVDKTDDAKTVNKPVSPVQHRRIRGRHRNRRAR